jgi:hypothetical protein
MLYTTIGQSILPETAFLAEIDVDTPILMWLPRRWFCIRALLHPSNSWPNSTYLSCQNYGYRPTSFVAV